MDTTVELYTQQRDLFQMNEQCTMFSWEFEEK